MVVNFPIVDAIMKPYLKKSLIQKLLIKNKKNHLFHQPLNVIETTFLLKKKLSMNISFKNLKKKIFFVQYEKNEI